MKRRSTKTIDRFWSKVSKTPTCWLWQGSLNNKGYGSISITEEQNKNIIVHRYAYQILKGQFPQELTIDHLCKVRNCVNPDHLEVVSFKENLLRGSSPSSVHAKKQFCPEGHKYDRKDKDGARRCSICNRAWQKKRRLETLSAFSSLLEASKSAASLIAEKYKNKDDLWGIYSQLINAISKVEGKIS